MSVEFTRENTDLITVRFTNPIMLGRECTPYSGVSKGDIIDGGKIEINLYDSMFMLITYARGYHQFVPWAAVGTAMFESKDTGEKRELDGNAAATATGKGKAK